MATPELFQFMFSHYNEKARWALDYKRVPHVRRSLLPGPHAVTIRRMTGQTKVPVLRDAGETIAGSAQIVAYLEARHPDPPLYPKGEDERRRALEMQTWFDDKVGPYIRRAFFFDLLPDGGYASGMFTLGRSGAGRATYRALFPVIRAVMKRDMKIDAVGAAEGRKRTAEALDFVVKNAGPGGYLVGDSFSVADLTAASLLMPVVIPPEFPYLPPEPRAKVLEDWLARWSGHPAIPWVCDMYKRHRGTSAAVRA